MLFAIKITTQLLSFFLVLFCLDHAIFKLPVFVKHNGISILSCFTNYILRDVYVKVNDEAWLGGYSKLRESNELQLRFNQFINLHLLLVFHNCHFSRDSIWPLLIGCLCCTFELLLWCKVNLFSLKQFFFNWIYNLKSCALFWGGFFCVYTLKLNIETIYSSPNNDVNCCIFSVLNNMVML